MIIVHDIFICKPGNASKLAKMWKDAMKSNKYVTDIMTDLVGPYNRVVMVSQYESLAEFEKMLQEYMDPQDKDIKESMAKMKDYQDSYLTGSREIYKVW